MEHSVLTGMSFDLRGNMTMPCYSSIEFLSMGERRVHYRHALTRVPELRIALGIISLAADSKML